ncbi:oligosaccharide flippase family protein [Streptococcus parauberis]|uniref:Flippase Wzx n=1 Tax=Streptococcus parauberis TaxID=1348 RepID=A0A0E2UDF3_9STRE|nr:oligosaccharide flippase family protein [Streptococcus parauberis]UWM91922.1 oligosaccharide flippase family protein [Streptococcus parauberis]BAU04041.1 flippase Wzx [Streptococcus parauberis]GAJ62102.1 polysaccharide biosynthesis protein [Streptococcus parauberis]
MNYRNTVRSFFGVVVSNFSSIVAGVIVGFAIPKILSVEDYGYLKTFTLYVSYMGLFSFGIIDGIVLEFGGKNYDELERLTFRNYFRWFFVVTFISALVIALVSIICFDSDLSFILFAISFNLIAINTSNYFQQISQITQRFKEYSLRKILQSFSNILLVILCFILYKTHYDVNYKFYIIMLVLINFGLCLWYVYTYREIIFGDKVSFFDSKNDIIFLIKTGVPLLIANISSVLIVTIDSQFVNTLFSTREYAMYAFAYNLLSLITIATAAISTILYPTLKRTEETRIKDNYGNLISILEVLIFAFLIAFFPLSIFVNWFLPNYSESLEIFRIIFPGVALTTPIVVIMHNYYKTLKKSNQYFFKSIMVLIFSMIANFIAYYFFKTTIAISVASIVVLFLWYVYVEREFVKSFNYKSQRNLSYILLLMTIFYCCSFITNLYIGCFVYIVLYCLVSLIYYKKLIVSIYNKITSNKHR